MSLTNCRMLISTILLLNSCAALKSTLSALASASRALRSTAGHPVLRALGSSWIREIVVFSSNSSGVAMSLFLLL